MTAFTEAAGLPGGVRWGANVRGYLQLATYVYKVCRDPVVKGGSAMVAPVPHPTIARDYCLAPARGIDAPQQGTSSKYGRLFPGVAPFTADEEFLIHLGGSEGPCDGGLFADDGWSACTATARVPPATCRAMPRGWRSSATRETMCTFSSRSSIWPCSRCTTCWSTGCARTASLRCAMPPDARSPGTTSGSS